MKEIWKDIKGYEDLYQISNLGRVKSLNYNSSNKEQILKFEIMHKGYRRVKLVKNGVKKNKRIGRLVGIHFIPNPFNKPQVNHIDGNKQNDIYTNIEWVTNAENMQHAYDIGIR